MITRYNQFNTWLKNKFGERTLKICIDGGFSCPNRDGTKGCGGCIFCGERGSGENTKRIDITAQVKAHLSSYKADRANKFIAYFQNYTNTFLSLDDFKKYLLEATTITDIVEFSISTLSSLLTSSNVSLSNATSSTK